MTTHKIESVEGGRIGDTIEIPNFAARIEESLRANKIREKIKDVRGGVLSQFVSEDPFGIRKDTDENVIDAEYEVM